MTSIIINDVLQVVPESSKRLPSHGNAWFNLLACLGYAPENLPLGGFLARYHQLDGHWLAVTPVHWEASHNNAAICAIGDELDADDESCRALFADVAAFMQEQDVRLHYHDRQIWLMNIDNKPAINSESVWAMRNRPMMDALQAMDSSLYWSSMMTEMQMYLSAHACPFNGLWFYGAAEFDASLLTRARIQTDDQQLIKAFPRQAEPIGAPLTRQSLVFLNHKSDAVTCRYNTRWYWNNAAYSTRARAWWKLF